MLAPLAGGDEGALLAMRSPGVRPAWGCTRVVIARAHLVRMLDDGRRPGQFRESGPFSSVMRMGSSVRLWPTTIALGLHPSEGLGVAAGQVALLPEALDDYIDAPRALHPGS